MFRLNRDYIARYEVTEKLQDALCVASRDQAIPRHNWLKDNVGE